MTTSDAILFPLVTDAMVEAAIRMQTRFLVASISGVEGLETALATENRLRMKLILLAALEAAPDPSCLTSRAS